MSGMLTLLDGPMVFLREDSGGPSKARVDRVRAYAARRTDRWARAWRRQEALATAERERHVPCALCGVPTLFWERHGLPDDLVICSLHTRRHRSVILPNAPPTPVDALYCAAKYALLNLEHLIKERSAHGQGPN